MQLGRVVDSDGHVLEHLICGRITSKRSLRVARRTSLAMKKAGNHSSWTANPLPLAVVWVSPQPMGS